MADEGVCPASEYDRAAALLAQLPVPPIPRHLRLADIKRHLRYDKKVRASKNVFVLLRGIGRPVRVSGILRGDVERALRAIWTFHGSS
jgi:3-dehydroquinate synthetase